MGIRELESRLQKVNKTAKPRKMYSVVHIQDTLDFFINGKPVTLEELARLKNEGHTLGVRTCHPAYLEIFVDGDGTAS